MAIGTTAAIVGGSLLGAGATALSASKNSGAINDATEAQTESNAQSLALQRDVYDQNAATLNPFVQRGNAAGDQLNALLGLPTAQQAQSVPTAQPNALAQFSGGYANNPGAPYGLGDGYIANQPFNLGSQTVGGNALNSGVWDQYLTANPDVLQGFNTTADRNVFSTPQQYGQWHYNNYGRNEGRDLPGQSVQAGQPPQTTQTTAQATAQNDAFDTFRDSTAYQFTFDEGQRGLEALASSGGWLQSGAALKAAQDRGQNVAMNNAFLPYASLLSGQQGAGLSAAGAQAGVGLNYANNVTGINQSNANALGSSAIAQANNNNALIGGIGGIAGNALGALAYQTPG